MNRNALYLSDKLYDVQKQRVKDPVIKQLVEPLQQVTT